MKMKFVKLWDLSKMSISGQIVSEMLAGYTQKTPYKPF